MERTTFDQLGIIQPILDSLHKEGYTHPTPIQEQAIPHLNKGRDLLGCAQTGTGKTAAFAIPILQELSERGIPNGRRPIRTLILTPTRELAIQIGESFTAYGSNLQVRHTVIFGGVGQKPQTDALHRGIDIVVATPGRLLDLMNQKFVDLSKLEIFVLDEADRMLDMGFIHDVKKVIAKIPAKRQTLFFSATMPNEIAKLANSILTDPIKVEVTPQSTTAETIDQKMYFVDRTDKNNLLVSLLSDSTIKEALVFTRTKHGANKVAKVLLQNNISAEAIHGNKSQTARQAALKNFKAGSTRVLVATDIAARGIDIDGLSYVINFDIPNIPETYVHRIGRTGRAGASGKALSFCDHEEKAFLRDILRLIKRDIPVEENHPFVMVGGPKKAAPEEPRERQNRRPAGGGQRSGQRSGDRPRSEGQRSGERQRTPRAPGEGRSNAERQHKAPGTAAPRREGEGSRGGQRPARGGDRNRTPGTGRPPRREGQGAPRQGQERRNDRPRTEEATSTSAAKPDYAKMTKELFDENETKSRSTEKTTTEKKGVFSRLFGKK